MDVRTPALILLCFVVAALAFALLGLAADNVSYAHKHANDVLDIHYLRWNQTAEATYSYWVQIDYLPSRYSLARINAMIGAAVATALASIAVATISWLIRGDQKSRVDTSINKEKRSMPLLPVGTVIAGIAFIVSLAVAIYAWYPVMKWSIDFKKSLPVPPSISGIKGSTVRYQSPFDFVPEMWNCWISEYTIDPSVGRTLRNVCNEASISKTLMLPIVVLTGALTIGMAFAWWRSARAGASTTGTETKDVEEVSM